MSPTDKHRLVQDIYFTLQSTYTTDEILNILNDYKIHSSPDRKFSQEALKRLITKADDATILEIATDLKLSLSFIKSKTTKQSKTKPALKKIFISHDEKDKDVVGSFIQILQGVGINPENIFCSSLEGYGIPLGINYDEDLKTRLQEDVLVLFMVSKHFYNSNTCMIQMGAAWALTKEQISIAIPPFQLEQMKGVFQNFQGIRINHEKQLDLLKETLEHKFGLQSQKQLHWEPKRDMVLRDIKAQLSIQ
ncbi:TIR domain-containing protein [Kordia periserrulae]|uniref:TIR domain-containing protein n=1 Tax=Kordia periserrulae TaxID=701523 RepID=A0A2T6BRZ3_9FLAO|nr:toll/interleukin-1 receptor domain-containing protein [Kordia periserrulae]PTX58819.1 TIR domain-containing protein [Kordia periserrulae]